MCNPWNRVETEIQEEGDVSGGGRHFRRRETFQEEGDVSGDGDYPFLSQIDL